MRPATRWSLDHHHLDIADWSYSETSEGGSDSATVLVPDAVLRRLPVVADEDSVLRGSIEAEVKFKGRLSQPPDFDDRTGLWSVQARGAVKDAEDRSDELFYQVYGTDEWQREDDGVVDLGIGTHEHIDAEVGGAALRWVAQKEALSIGDSHFIDIWKPGQDIRRVAGTVKLNRAETKFELRSRTGTGPTGPTSVEADLSLSGSDTHTLDEAIAAGNDVVALAMRAINAHTPASRFIMKIIALRINGRTTADSFSVTSLIDDVSDLLGWDASGVSGLSLNVLPLDWIDAWSELLTYAMTGLYDGHWGVYGEDDKVVADTWANAETVYAYRGYNAFPELSEMPVYDDVIVYWQTRKGTWKHYPRTIDRTLRYYPITLSDVQPDDDLAQSVRTNLTGDVTEPRPHGRVVLPTTVMLSPGGPEVPSDYLRPGMKLVIPNYGEMRSVTLRVTDTDKSRDQVIAGCDDTTSHVRYENRARLIAQRRAGRRKSRSERR